MIIAAVGHAEFRRMVSPLVERRAYEYYQSAAAGAHRYTSDQQRIDISHTHCTPLRIASVPSVTSVYCVKTADSIKMPFGMVDRVGPRNDVLDGGPDPPTEGGANFGVNGAARGTM